MDKAPNIIGKNNIKTGIPINTNKINANMLFPDFNFSQMLPNTKIYTYKSKVFYIPKQSLIFSYCPKSHR
jgi:hypothetical protein